MQATSTRLRILSVALAVLCSFGLFAVVGEQLNPVRLAMPLQVIRMEAVTISAPAPAPEKPLAAAAARTAAN